jgi:hypothetical protein
MHLLLHVAKCAPIGSFMGAHLFDISMSLGGNPATEERI